MTMLVRVFPDVCVNLSREAEETGGALAVGLCKVVQKYNFVSSLYMMCDVLPAVSRLSCVLQSTRVDLHWNYSVCLQVQLRMNTLDADLENSLAQCEITVSPESKL